MTSSSEWHSIEFLTSSQADASSSANSISASFRDISLTDSDESSSERSSAGHLSSFVFLLSGLEQALRVDEPLILGPDVTFAQDRTPIGDGASFRVERARWSSTKPIGKFSNRWRSSVALKYTLHHADVSRMAVSWRQLLSEVRALLHEPIRFHPNIVRLLGISWTAVDGMRSNFPALVLELSELGTFAHLQLSSEESLPFDVKKRLCWDVAKGISILHSCGVVHGDLKHENVLIYPNQVPEGPVQYVAKISDFGGSIMDLQSYDFRSLRTPTRLWTAPEFFTQTRMSEEELKLTDVYSLGLLVWRTILDGRIPYHFLRTDGEPMTDSEVYDLKQSDQMLERAKETILSLDSELGNGGGEILTYVFEHTIQLRSAKRSLTNSVAALQVNTLSEKDSLLLKSREANEKDVIESAKLKPGWRGLTLDGLEVFRAKNNFETGDYDYQRVGPGYRPVLTSPAPGQFLFEPHRLRGLLSWDIQSSIVHDLEAVISYAGKATPAHVSPVIAAFYLFRCYCYEFGTAFDAGRACHWLKFAASCDDECIESYLARAWFWRVHNALGVVLDVGQRKLRDWMEWAVIHGHRKCLFESALIIPHLQRSEIRERWVQTMVVAELSLRVLCGNVGMPYFAQRKLHRNYNLNVIDVDLEALDKEIQTELALQGLESIDGIVVNHRGDGLLNMAASMGKLKVLKHLIEVYKPDVNQYNPTRHETPLFSACRSGHLDCALYLLEQGAAANGFHLSQEKPLEWLSAFKEDEIPIIATHLVQSGASLRSSPHPSLASVRAAIGTKFIWADYENISLLPASPLSRAVMMENLSAVKALLALGADPLEGFRDPVHPETDLSVCAVVVAAVMTLPPILEILLDHIDANTSSRTRIFSEIDMLEMALDRKATMADPMALENRLTRLGMMYKPCMISVLQILHEREKMFIEEDDFFKKANSEFASARMITRLVSLGCGDIVEALLSLGHTARGLGGAICAFPIVAAVEANDESIFRILLDHGADATAQYEVPYPSRKQSLLQILADRPRQTRPGLGIARLLIEKDVAIDPLSDEFQSRSAFCSAVLRQDFELADLLLEHSADVDYLYLREQGGSLITVFGEVVSTPTEKNLQSLEYLLRLQKAPTFLVSPAMNWTVYHLAAAYNAQTDSHRHILGRMVRMILAKDCYSSDEIIGYRTPSLSSAPSLAALLGNLEVVTAFLDTGYALVRHFNFRGWPALSMLNLLLILGPERLPAELMIRMGKDNASREASMERYKLIVNCLSELQQ